ncbi:MAG: hypothetical protein CME36_07745 [unclassified Hahellaceae]|nr:hypothetical protein [Hahellaceae bacterium]|tara:strand:+ start:34193 stop:35785 length:1593 start_codon:yes stop_codon:yes gene_type:complete
MRSLLRGLGYAVLFSLLLAVVAYSVLLWQTERWIERVRAAGADQFSLSHGLARFDIDGALHIADLRFTDYRLQEPIVIERLSVRFNSVVDAVSFAVSDLFDDSSLPTALTFEITNGSVPVSAEWSVLDPDLLPQASKPWVDYACGSIRPFEKATFKQLGFVRLRVDGDLHYEFITDENVFAVLGELRSVGFQTLGISASAVLSHDLSWPPPEDAEPPRLQHLQLNLTEEGFWQRFAQLCQGETGLESQAYWSRSLNQTRARLSEAGIVVGGDLWAKLPEYLQGKAPLDVQFHPRGDFDPALMPFLDFKEQLARLGFQLQVAGARITAADLSVAPKQLANFITPPAPPKPAPRVARPPQDLDIPLASLELAAEFAGRQVEVVRKVGARLQGRLLEAGPRRLTIMTQLGGGEVLYHLQGAELDRVTIRAVPADTRDQFQKRLEAQSTAIEEAEVQAPAAVPEPASEPVPEPMSEPVPETAPSAIDDSTEALDEAGGGEGATAEPESSADQPMAEPPAEAEALPQNQVDEVDE